MTLAKTVGSCKLIKGDASLAIKSVQLGEASGVLMILFFTESIAVHCGQSPQLSLVHRQQVNSWALR